MRPGEHQASRGRGGAGPGRSEPALLLTGPPGIGKTTVLAAAAHLLSASPLRGFTTQEIRERGRRVGFRLRSFGGREAILAHVGIRSSARVGRYGVDIAALDLMVEQELVPASTHALYLVDEIGKMECYSPRFVDAVTALLDVGVPLVATISERGAGPIAAIKRRADVRVVEVSLANRDRLPVQVQAWLLR